MKTFRNISLIALLLAGLVSTSCTKHKAEIDPEENGKKEQGYLSLKLNIGKPVQTRAEGETPGQLWENMFYGIHIILYDANGQSQLIEYYDIVYDIYSDQIYSNSGRDMEGISYDSSTGILTLPPLGSEENKKVYKQPYQVLVVLNGESLKSTPFPANQNQENYIYKGPDYAALLDGSHSFDQLNGPVNLYSAFNNNSNHAIGYGIGYFLSYLRYNSAYPNPYNAEESWVAMVMSNADGLVTLRASDVKDTPEEAAGNPVRIKVERALARVSVHNRMQEPGAGEKVDFSSVRWGTDIMNLRTNIVRTPATTAPNTPGGQQHPEDKDTPRAYRYAEDANFSGLSYEAKGEAQDWEVLKTHFYRIPKAAELSLVNGAEHPYLIRNWAPLPGDSEEVLALEDYEYVTENTMDAAEQYEDVTTRVILRCNYIPTGYQTVGGAQIMPGESYYFYNGLAITEAQMKSYMVNPGSIPVNQYPALIGLINLLVDPEVEDAFGWGSEDVPPPLGGNLVAPENITRGGIAPGDGLINPDNEVEHNRSITAKGLSYYKAGINYYSLPIRHFDDGESPIPMGYGRYGVVRNNTYRLLITDIKAPGHTDLPDPQGPDDKDNGPVEAHVLVAPWTEYKFDFDL